MEEYYGHNDWRDYLAHSWGHSPKQKAREKEYNHSYWLRNREEILRKRKMKLSDSAKANELLDRSINSYRKAGGHLSLDEAREINRRQANGDYHGTDFASRSERIAARRQANRQAQIDSEVSALKNQNAANYRQNQINSEVSALKNQNAANYQARQASNRQAQINSEVSALKNQNAANYRQSQAQAAIARHKTANVAAAKKGRDALDYLLQ